MYFLEIASVCLEFYYIPVSKCNFSPLGLCVLGGANNWYNLQFIIVYNLMLSYEKTHNSVNL